MKKKKKKKKYHGGWRDELVQSAMYIPMELSQWNPFQSSVYANKK
jgi:hypothetical protein